MTGSPDGPVHYMPCLRNGAVIGYLWVTPDGEWYGFCGRADGGDDVIRIAGEWAEWLKIALGNGSEPLRALRTWVGRDTGKDIGVLVAGGEGVVDGYDALVSLAGRSAEPVPDGPGVGYPDDARVAVRFAPIRAGAEDRTVAGYLWYSVDDRAAGFVRTAAAPAELVETWAYRLRMARARGVAPHELIGYWHERPELDRPETAGYQASPYPEHADGLLDVQRRAGRHR